MNDSEYTIKCQTCGKDIITSKEWLYKAINNKKGINFCEKDWKENSKQYLENYQNVYRSHLERGKIEYLKKEQECNVCKKTFLVKEADLNEKNDLCYECRLADNKLETVETNKKPAEIEQQPTTEENKNSKGVSGGVIILIILTVASILGGIVYYSWNKSKNK